MMTLLRWLGRALLALLVLVLLGGIWVCWRFEQWKKETIVALDGGSKVVQTSAGAIEYTEIGSGPAVLVCHGAPGGYDQAALIGAALAKEGFRIIAPSRPGFLRTPLTTGLLFDDQADALAALLDKLDVKKVSVLGFSTGAPVAVDFAIRHPDRTGALVLLAPVTVPYQRWAPTEPRPLLSEAALYQPTGDMGAWLFVEQAKRDPRWLLDGSLAIDTALNESARRSLVDFVLHDPAQLAFFQSLVGTIAPLSPRETGTRNDLLQIRVPPSVAYEKIQAPVLLVHGAADGAAKWDDPKQITDKLPFAKVVAVRDAGQLVWLGPNAAAAQQAVQDFLGNPPPISTPTPTPTPSPTPAAS